MYRLTEIKQGFAETSQHFICLGCGFRVEQGVIHPDSGTLYEARRFIQRHIETRHGSVFSLLIGLDKGATGLSEVQRNLLRRTYEGESDEEIRQGMGMGSTSTVRNHRLSLREKERQARVFVTLMDLLQQVDRTERKTHNDPDAKRLQTYFPQGPSGPMLRFPSREKQRAMVVRQLAERFVGGRKYREKEVNQILSEAWHDYSTVRRYMVSYGLLGRHDDGSQYWRIEEETMDRRTELKQMAKETKPVAGIYQIKNLRTGRVLVQSTRNLKTINGQQFQLEAGGHRNEQLQQDWKTFGKDAFSFDILETLEEDGDLGVLKKKWLDQLQPYGDHGYNV